MVFIVIFLVNFFAVDIYEAAKTINEIKDDMIPEELLYSLTHSQHVQKKKKAAQLSPIKEIRTPEKMKMVGHN